MIIISDCGGTKSDWAIVCNSGAIHNIQTGGINPIHQNNDSIVPQLEPVVRLASQFYLEKDHLIIHFYGAGCNAIGAEMIRPILTNAFERFSPTIYIYSDLLGSARSLCQHNEGIACILGTGSNSCFYDGNIIINNTPPLGYILGDEGSGAALGKLFLHHLLKGQLSSQLLKEFYETYQITYPQLIQRIYKQTKVNHFLASFVPFIHKHLDNEMLYQLIITEFRHFFSYNIVPYGHRDLPVNFVGSIAYFFHSLLDEAARIEGFHLGNVTQTPMPGLLQFHL